MENLEKLIRNAESIMRTQDYFMQFRQDDVQDDVLVQFLSTLTNELKEINLKIAQLKGK